MTRREFPDCSSEPEGDGVDQMLEAYVAWREKCLEVWDAYNRWVRAQTDHAARGFADYTAALDAEERAAGMYADSVRRVRQVISTKHKPVMRIAPRNQNM